MLDFWPVADIFSVFWGPVWVCFWDFLLFFLLGLDGGGGGQHGEEVGYSSVEMYWGNR